MIFLYHRIELGEIRRKSSWRHGRKFHFWPVFGRERKSPRDFSVQISIVFHAIHFRRDNFFFVAFSSPFRNKLLSREPSIRNKNGQLQSCSPYYFQQLCRKPFFTKACVHWVMALPKYSLSLKTSNSKTKRTCKKWWTGRF